MNADAGATSEKGKTNEVKMEHTVFPFCERGDFCPVPGMERNGVLGPHCWGPKMRKTQKELQGSFLWNGPDEASPPHHWGAVWGCAGTRAWKALG